MITFKQFLSESSSSADYIELPSFAEIRHKVKTIREDSSLDTNYPKHPQWIHDQDGVKPTYALNNYRQRKYIMGYTSGSGREIDGHRACKVMNQKLLNDNGIQSDNQFTHQHDERDIDQAIKDLSETIRHPENRNRIPVTMFSGIHYKVGRKISDMKIGDTDKIPKFSSATSDLELARGFGEIYADPHNRNIHVIHAYCHPGSGMSVSHYPDLTNFTQEYEFLLDHGTKIKKTKESELVDGVMHHYIEACHRNDNAIQ